MGGVGGLRGPLEPTLQWRPSFPVGPGNPHFPPHAQNTPLRAFQARLLGASARHPRPQLYLPLCPEAYPLSPGGPFLVMQWRRP